MFGVFIGILILIFILLLVNIFSGQNPAPVSAPSPLPVFSPRPINIPPFVPPPVITTEPANTATSSYGVQDLDKDYERITARQPLSSSDLAVKQKLLALLNNQSGFLQTEDTYQIEYVKTADSFMVELDSSDPDTAKAQAAGWFREQGFSIQGICNLPVVFYLSQNTMSYLRENNLKFNPVPEGCQ